MFHDMFSRSGTRAMTDRQTDNRTYRQTDRYCRSILYILRFHTKRRAVKSRSAVYPLGIRIGGHRSDDDDDDDDDDDVPSRQMRLGVSSVTLVSTLTPIGTHTQLLER